jgi:putative sterol carrier protein
MTVIFPSPEWLQILEEKLNTDKQYAEIARNWEGDMCVDIIPSGPITQRIIYYLDLWHGKCRKTEIYTETPVNKPKFLLTATYQDIARIMKGELDPMQAMMTRKLQVHGSLAYMMRNVPTVLDFVRCCRDITTEVIS